MKVKYLIEKLQECDGELPITAILINGRIPCHMVAITVRKNNILLELLKKYTISAEMKVSIPEDLLEPLE